MYSYEYKMEGTSLSATFTKNAVHFPLPSLYNELRLRNAAFAMAIANAGH